MGENEKVRISQYGNDHLTLVGLTEEERERVEGMLHGQWWAKGNEEGRIDFALAREPVPEPADDEEMMPFWSPAGNGSGPVQMQLIFNEGWEGGSPGIFIQHLCGYYFTPENYRAQAELLESYGFVCMRSKRGNDGRFWEIWFLPGLWAAKGDLKDTIAPFADEKKKHKEAILFLGRRCSFGTLDTAVQRLAMVID